ncbi:MAG TPA: response regulator transcription factor [Candidatus Micrarchaeia archaeon]|nr:response regulator transcription factor [Candidatus Micrarchaeia archaeon]
MASTTAADGEPPTARILVVDDEPNITDLLATALRYERYEVEVAAAGRVAVERCRAFRPDLVVLDVMLPDLDGFEVARRLSRELPRVPVLFLTARDAVADKVHGLRLGADDYLTKPFSLSELSARVQAVLRRARHPGPGRLVCADLELDDDAHEVRRGGVPIPLTATEYSLLRFLLRNGRRVVSKAQILDHVWPDDFEGADTVVETYVSYLRRKLDPLGPPLIRTVRGVGYTIRPPGP